jgi:hypothetical protein
MLGHHTVPTVETTNTTNPVLFNRCSFSCSSATLVFTQGASLSSSLSYLSSRSKTMLNRYEWPYRPTRTHIQPASERVPALLLRRHRFEVGDVHRYYHRLLFPLCATNAIISTDSTFTCVAVSSLDNPDARSNGVRAFSPAKRHKVL